jgi:hypothetical protein
MSGERQRRLLRKVARDVCEAWGQELASDPSAFLPLQERDANSFTDEQCAAIYAVWLADRDRYAVEEACLPSVDPTADDEAKMSAAGHAVWGWICVHRDSMSTPEVLQRGKNAVSSDSRAPQLSIDEQLAQGLTKAQWLVVQGLRQSSNKVRFSTLKTIQGAFRKGEESSDRAVETLLERAAGVLAEAGLATESNTSGDGERWVRLVDLTKEK